MISATMCSGASSTSWYVAPADLVRPCRPRSVHGRSPSIRSKHSRKPDVCLAFIAWRVSAWQTALPPPQTWHQPCTRFRNGRVRLGSRDRPGHIRRLVTCLPNCSGPFAFQAGGLQFTDGLGVIKTGAHAGNGISTSNDGTHRGKPVTSEDLKPGTASAVVMRGFPCDGRSPRPCGLPFKPDSALARRSSGAGSGAAGSDLSPIQQ